jgi:hypothetical protein
VEVSFTPEEKVAFQKWCGPARWVSTSGHGGQESDSNAAMYAAVNQMLEGKDPGKGQAANMARTMLHACNMKSTPSKQTIYRGTGGGEFKPGQLDAWKKALAAGKTVDLSVPIMSNTYDPGVWAGNNYRYVIDPGALTLDAGHSMLTGEYETVTGGMFEVYEIEPNPKNPSQTLIKMRQVAHYAQ